MATKIHVKKLYTLEQPIWLDAAGMSKGIYHDKQHLGIILAPGATIKIRRTIPDGSKSFSALKLNLLNYDSKLEHEFKVKSDWISCVNNSTTASVPFISTLFNSVEPTVEYEIPANSKILPIYEKFDSETEFFQLWDSQHAEFGLIVSDYIQLLVPVADKEVLRKLKAQPNIDGLISYYDRILTFYNDLSGLSFEPTKHDSDRNITTRYFLKADAHGAGGAYYGGSWCAESTPSTSGFWLDCQDKLWGNLHEIGHGYEGGFMNTHGFSVHEVWNNLYAATYQNAYLGEKIWTDGWLYDYGSASAVFEGINSFISQKKPLEEWDLRSKLVFLTTMKDRAGNNAFTHFNRRYRKECNDPAFVPGNSSLLDMLSESYRKIAGIDITPFAMLVGGKMTDAQIRRNVLYHEKAVYPVNQLVSAGNLPKILGKLNTKNPYTLVDPSQLSAFGFTGDLEFSFNIQDFKQIYGEPFVLMEGQRYGYVNRITTQSLKISNVPIGVYTIIVPTGKSVKYTTSTYYAICKEGGSKISIDFKPKRCSWLLNSGFNILGLSNGFVGSIKVDYVEQVIAIDVTNDTPHSYFPGEDYARVTILNKNAVVFDKVMQGTKVTPISQKIPFELGYVIKLWHAEPDRMRVVDTFGKNVKLDTKDNSFILRDFGVADTAAEPKDLIEQLKLKIAAEAAQIRGELRRLRSKFDIQKDDLFLAINALPEPHRSELKGLYKDILPTENSEPGPLVGQSFVITYSGLGNSVFFRATVDLVKRVVTFESLGGAPHAYFTDTYSALVFVNAHGVERAKFNFIGDKESKSEIKTFPLAFNGGEKLTLHHKEAPTRLSIKNEMQGNSISAERNVVYEVVSNGLKLISSSADEKADPVL